MSWGKLNLVQSEHPVIKTFCFIELYSTLSVTQTEQFLCLLYFYKSDTLEEVFSSWVVSSGNQRNCSLTFLCRIQWFGNTWNLTLERGVFMLSREVRKPVNLLSNVFMLFSLVWKHVKFNPVTYIEFCVLTIWRSCQLSMVIIILVQYFGFQWGGHQVGDN